MFPLKAGAAASRHAYIDGGMAYLRRDKIQPSRLSSLPSPTFLSPEAIRLPCHERFTI